MNANEILIKIRDAWLNDAPLTEWCMMTYGQAPTIFMGMDGRNPPDESLYPIIAVFSATLSGGIQDPTMLVEVAASVVDEEIEDTPMDGFPRYRQWLGMGRVQDLLRLARTALVRASFGKITMMNDAEDISIHPYYTAKDSVQIEGVRLARRLK